MSRSTLTETAHSQVKPPAERSFGLLFTAVFSGLGTYGLYKGWSSGLIVTSFGTSFALALAAAFAPRILAPLNLAWFWLGQCLGRIVSPIVLGIIYFGIIAPVGLIARASGRDELKLKRRSVSSYWVERNPPGPAPNSFNNQF